MKTIKRLLIILFSLIIVLGFMGCDDAVNEPILKEEVVETKLDSTLVSTFNDATEEESEDLSNQTFEEFLQEMYYDAFDGEENINLASAIEDDMRNHFSELKQARIDDNSNDIDIAYEKMDKVMRSAGLEIPFKSFSEFVESMKDDFTEEEYNEILDVYYEADDLYYAGAYTESDKVLEKIEKYFVPFGYEDIAKLVEEKDSGITTLATYDIIDGELVFVPINLATEENVGEENIKKYTEIWEEVLKTFPEAYMDIMVSLDISTDGRDGNLAAIFPLEEDNVEFALSIDPADAYDVDGTFKDASYGEEDFYGTLVHEFGHILTLNSTQFLYERDETNSNLTLEEGTFKDNAYLNIFFQRFWTDNYDELLDIQDKDAEGDTSYTSEVFHQKYTEQFVTEYASTNPAEDMAESYRFFVLFDEPEGNSIADRKVLFYYEFEETVKQREEIRENLGFK